MVLALRHPELVERLCVVDVSPVAYDHLSEFEGYVAAMRGLDLGSLSRRDDADAALAKTCPTRPCAASCCRTSAGTATSGAGRSTSTCSAPPYR